MEIKGYLYLSELLLDFTYYHLAMYLRVNLNIKRCLAYLWPILGEYRTCLEYPVIVLVH